MKKLFIILLSIICLCFTPVKINAETEENIKETINKENKDGMKLILIGSSIIVIILGIYKKKKISL